MHVCLLHNMCVRLRNDYTRAYAQIIQHTYIRKAVTRLGEDISYSIGEGNQTIDMNDRDSNMSAFSHC